MTEAQISIEDYQVPNTESIIKIASISGQLDESNIDEKIKSIYDLIDQVPNSLKLLLNLENLDYMNSKSIGYLTDIYGKVMKGSGVMIISSAKANIMDILQVVGLTQLVKTFPNIEEAKTYLAGHSAAQVLAEPETPTPPAAPASPAPTVEENTAPASPAPTVEENTAPATPAPAIEENIAPPAAPASPAPTVEENTAQNVLTNSESINDAQVSQEGTMPSEQTINDTQKTQGDSMPPTL